MPSSAIATAVTESIGVRQLLDHPYYRAWQDGLLRQSDLAEYAAQYRHFESCLPEVLAEAASSMAEGPARQLVEANLRDEMGSPRAHLEMFDDFADAVGAASCVDATPATGRLVDLYRSALTAGAVPFLATVAAYESQAAAVADTKSASLSDHYGLAASGAEFWAVHADTEIDHAEWTLQALESLGASPVEIDTWAGRSAQAWWEFLDEREAARAA